MVFLGHRRSLCCLAAHPQAPFLSGGGGIVPRRSLGRRQCSRPWAAPSPHSLTPPCTQGLAWDPGSAELGAPPGPHLEVTSML